MTQQAATPVSLAPVDAAYVRFIETIKANRPHALRADNSLEALQGRAADVEAQIIACRDWLAALVEDTAAHCSLPRRTADHVVNHMQDAVGDVRGDLLAALESMEAERRPVRLVR